MIFSGHRFIGLASSILLFASWQTGAAASFPNGHNIMTYWGQNSANTGSSQMNLAFYCDDSSDVLILSLITQFNVGGLPTLNLANACTGTFFNGTNLLKCDQVGEDIKTCQQKGKKIILSLGGASGAYGFTSDDQGVQFAQTVWDLFGNGNSDTRPFGDAVVDGFDLDIEGGGDTGYVAFVKALRSHFATDSSKDYYITAAPQCPFPDAMLGNVINSVGFDAISVQFYNNYCSSTSSSFNFDTWDEWARNTSPNKDVKIFMGIPGSPTAAGSGYVPFSQLQSTVEKVASTYSSYGGVTVWDASQSYGNTEVSPNFAAALGNLVHSGRSTTTTTTATTSTATSTTSSAPTGTPTSGSGSDGCIKDGDPCSTQGEYSCAGNSFGICDNGQWVLQPCAAGLVCMGSTNSNSVYCAQGTASNTCGSSGLTSSGVTPCPYQSSRVTAQLSVIETDNRTFEAVVNARKLDTKPFGSTVVVEMTMPPNITVDEVTGGQVKQSGRTVKLQIKNPKKRSMALVFTIQGSVKSGVFVAPDSDSIKFMT